MVHAAETRLLIGGELVAGDAESLAVENPFSEETMAVLALPSDALLDAAIAPSTAPAPATAPVHEGRLRGPPLPLCRLIVGMRRKVANSD